MSESQRFSEDAGYDVAVSKKVREVAKRLRKEGSLTRQERVFVEGLLDGTWRLTPDGSFVSIEQGSATSSKLGLGAQSTYSEFLPEMFERAKMRVRTIVEAEVEKHNTRAILDHILAGTLGVLTGILLIVAVAAFLR